MEAEPSKKEEQRRVEAVDAICEPILYEARARGRADMISALHEVYCEVSGRILELMDALRKAEREAGEHRIKDILNQT